MGRPPQGAAVNAVAAAAKLERLSSRPQDAMEAQPRAPPAAAKLRSHDAWAPFLHKPASYCPPPGCHLKTAPEQTAFDAAAAAALYKAAITRVEVLAALRKLYNGRSSGCSELPAEWFRYAVPTQDAVPLQGSSRLFSRPLFLFLSFLIGYRLPAGSAADRGDMLEMRRHRTENARGSNSEGWTARTC